MIDKNEIEANAKLFVPQTAAETLAKRKIGIVSWNWWDTWQEEHQRAFVVAKLASADLLTEVRTSLEKAIAEGQSYEQWRKAIIPKLQNRWIGRSIGTLWDELPQTEKANRQPPSDEECKKLIAPKRLETIFRTNMRVAYTAGRYKLQMSIAEDFPYWRYVVVDDGRTRDSHRALKDKVFRYDHPIWETHYPPNGWNCRCKVQALDQDDLDYYGLKPETGGTIATEQSPNGLPYAIYEDDTVRVSCAPGWSYNSGKDPQLGELVGRKQKNYSPELADMVRKDVWPVIKTQSRKKSRFRAITRQERQQYLDRIEAVTNQFVSQSDAPPRESIKKPNIESEKNCLEMLKRCLETQQATQKDYSKLFTHMREGDGLKKKDGDVSGAHNLWYFIAQYAKRVDALEHPLKITRCEGFDKCFLVEYYNKKNPDQPHRKTVYLPEIEEVYFERAIQAYEQAIDKLPHKEGRNVSLSNNRYIEGIDNSGARWFFYIGKHGVPVTMYPELLAEENNNADN